LLRWLIFLFLSQGEVMLFEMQAQLQAYIDTNLTDLVDSSVSDLTSISAGWESDVYSFVLEHGRSASRKTLDQILRIYPGDDAYEKSAREFEGMRKLYQAGYPVPEVMSLERDESPFKKPFVIMERIEGQTMGALMANSEQASREDYMRSLSGLMSRLHSMDWQAHTDPTMDYGDPYSLIDQML
jgi:aminoglycoside phosphotransferase (APT) family kinase protein